VSKKEIAVKKYVVRLTGEERAQVEAMIRAGKNAAQILTRARILLKAGQRKTSARSKRTRNQKPPPLKSQKALKRTEGAVRQKAKTIGVGLGHRR
jgi:hypothetical protein